MKRLIPVILILLLTLSGCRPVEPEKPTVSPENPTVAPEKPVIYLYPEEEMTVNVKLDFGGTLTTTYPEYNDGWTVVAHPDGTLINPDTGKEYYCLFWEGVSDINYTITSGFVVAASETEAFLEESLAALGLTRREANEFIIYWLPRMENNAWNLISFQTEAYSENARLEVTPSPDSMLRVFMIWQALDAPLKIESQELPSFERTGFTVVEWGGAEITE